MQIPINRALALTMGGSLIAALVVGGITLDRRLVAELEEDARKDLAMTPPLVVDRQTTQGEMLRMHAMELAGSEPLGEALASGDSGRAVLIASEMTAAWAEEPVVIDGGGRVWHGPHTAAELSPRATLEGGPYSVLLDDDGLHGVALADVVREGREVGAAGVSRPLDAAAAEVLAGLTRSDVILLGGGNRIVASTLEPSLAEALAAAELEPADDGVAEAALADRGRFWLTGADLGPDGRALFVRSAEEELAALPGLRGAALLAAGIALAVTLLTAMIVARSLSRPVQALAGASRELAGGDFAAPLPSSRIDEVETVSRAFEDMREALERRLRELADVNLELENRQARLQALQAELVRHDRLVAAGRLVTELAHEIRNPVANVRNSLEVVRRRVEDPKARRFTDLAIDELLRMHELAERMLDLNRPRDEGETCDARGVADGVVELVELGDREGRWPISIEGPAELPVAMPADPLKQVLLNLVTNAKEAMPDGGPIEIRLDGSKDEAATVSVVDRGPGLAEDVLPHVFDPFFTTKEAVHGVGLGLFVAEGLVRRARGSLSAANREPGPGAVLKLELPTAGADAP